MFRWIVDFFWNKQTFVSAVGDAVGVASVIVASPEIQAAVIAVAGPWAAVAIPLVAYAGGVLSGRTTNR